LSAYKVNKNLLGGFNSDKNRLYRYLGWFIGSHSIPLSFSVDKWLDFGLLIVLCGLVNPRSSPYPSEVQAVFCSLFLRIYAP
jgi:hypothetical protein